MSDKVSAMSFTEDKLGQIQLTKAITAKVAAGHLSTTVTKLIRGPVEDGQTLTEGSATLTYDEGAKEWTLEPSGASPQRVLTLLQALADRFASMSLPDKITVAAEDPDVSIVPNLFN